MIGLTSRALFFESAFKFLAAQFAARFASSLTPSPYILPPYQFLQNGRFFRYAGGYGEHDLARLVSAQTLVPAVII